MIRNRNRPSPTHPRHGVTLIEMLVTVALLVLMMTVIVQVFQAATGAVSSAKTFQELDDKLRQLDITLRQDLDPLNLTATFTPPLNPKHNKGYFEYGENSYADIQGEDTDDYLRFTTRAPAGQYFTGRAYITPLNAPGGATAAMLQNQWRLQPITIRSQFAEIIYFLRNGNLYRRVLLVAPDRQASVTAAYAVNGNIISPAPPAFGGVWGSATTGVSWQGMNDLSAHPAPVFNSFAGAPSCPIILNTLGDLTNRENRFPAPRFCNDFDSLNNAGMQVGFPDGTADDLNQAAAGGAYFGDNIPDYYPSLYSLAFSNPNQVIYEAIPAPRSTGGNVNSFDTMAFPYIYPGAYSQPDVFSASNGLGWIHTPDPGNNQQTLALLNQLNHGPFDSGDNLPFPSTTQTWWGFPTWRETMSANWLDPLKILSDIVRIPTFGQPQGLHPVLAVTPPTSGTAGAQLLPPMTSAYRLNPPIDTDSAGSTTFWGNGPGATPPGFPWNQSWEDDLVMTNVRSFDVKAYDNAYTGYVDLGWGNDLRLYEPYRGTVAAAIPATPQLLNNTPLTAGIWPPNATGLAFDIINGSFAHEGRMPPRVLDNRADFQFPNLIYLDPASDPTTTLNTIFNNRIALGGFTNNNIGDDQPGVVRLRRVWDTWSTDYAYAPSNGIDPANNRLPIGPPFTPPVYPSYPPPYPAPLRGIQIQIRVVDPRNERVKVLTIRQDFTTKLN